MAFWSRKASPQSASITENPYLTIALATFDRDSMINDIADHLRRMASAKLQASDVVAALQTALGAEIAALIERQNPNAGPDSLRYIMEQVFGTIVHGVREAAYTAADLPEPETYVERNLTEEEFHELTNRVVNAATQNNVPITELMTATAKALGLVIGILSERPGVDLNELIVFSQQAIDQFARESVAVRQQKR